MGRLKTPVVFVIFNRPDLAATTFREIARARPSKLLVIADGPRSHVPGEDLRCAETRKVLELIDWECELLTNFSNTNLGCKGRLSSGLNWAFEQVEEAIILEDDCVPDPSFFPYCEELLEKYRGDSRVMAIGGTNILGEAYYSPYSYFFSEVPMVWGWATWRRAWKHYDLNMNSWPDFKKSGRLKQIIPSWLARTQWKLRMDRVHQGEVDTWDYQWTFSVWKQNGYSILPGTNLITNIGFGPAATHTHQSTANANLARSTIQFPLRHPPLIQVDATADRVYFKLQSQIVPYLRGRLKRMNPVGT